ncbi:hypothetical protein JW962_02105 [Candidatus Dojkabacteria bacterium]|nr:hypothetical protein [Candidatus Dojkabacteria bacterium]
MRGDFAKKIKGKNKGKARANFGFGGVVFRLLLLLLLLGGLGVGYLFIKTQIEVSSIKVSYSQDFVINRSEKNTNSWLWVYVDSKDLYHTTIIKICGYFPWENTRTINSFCLDGDGYMQIDNSGSMAKVSSLLVRAAMLAEPNIVNGFLGILEGSLAYRFDNVVIVPLECDSSNLLGEESSFPDIVNVLDLGFWDLAQNQSQIEALVSCSYGNPSKNDLTAFRSQLKEYTLKSFELMTFANSVTQQDGSTLVGITYESWDKMFREISAGTPIKLEQTQVEVFNTTDIAGYAGFFSRSFNHYGLNVIRTDNIPGGVYDECGRSKIYVTKTKNKFEESCDVIEFMLFATQGQFPEIIEGPPPFIYTGDIIVIICSPLDVTTSENK